MFLLFVQRLKYSTEGIERAFIEREMPLEVYETLFCQYYMFLISFFVNPGLGTLK